MTLHSFFRKPIKIRRQWCFHFMADLHGAIRSLFLEPLEQRRLLAVDFGDAPDWIPGTGPPPGFVEIGSEVTKQVGSCILSCL
jgi:hypothetical protein